MKPLISIIIPTHNNEKTIEIALLSMINQTYPNLEIIIIDDHSTDATPQIVKNLTKKYSHVFFYDLIWDDPVRFNKNGRNINAGYLARNYGFTKSHGEWITFQDGDDASLSNRIEVQYDLAIQYGASHVCIQWMQYKPELLNKKLNVERILSEKKNLIIDKKTITKLAQKTKGVLIPFLGKFNSKIPFEIKTKRIINKLFFASLEPYPGSGNCPLFKKEVLDKAIFRKTADRIWPSFVGRGADRDFNFQVAETFKNSYSFRIPLYLYRADRQNDGFEGYEKYIV
jgi:glycosyltransferase involved in cell wall biosynthesis